MPVIYVDVLLAINLLIDFLLLSATAYLLHIPAKRWRLAMGAAAGAVSALVILLPDLPLALTLIGKLLTAAVLVLIAFPRNGVRGYIKELLVLFGVSVVFAGVSFGLWTALKPQGMSISNGVVYYDVPPLMLAVFSMVSYLALRLYDRFTRKKAPRQGLYRLRIDGGAGVVEMNALYDTGLHITEQFSGSPVIVAQYDAVASCLPTNLRYSLDLLMEGRGDGLSSHAALRSRLRLIPFHTIEGDGCLPAFCPVSVWLMDHQQTANITGAYVAVSRRLKSREYQALIGNDLTDVLTETEGGFSCEESYTV